MDIFSIKPPQDIADMVGQKIEYLVTTTEKNFRRTNETYLISVYEEVATDPVLVQLKKAAQARGMFTVMLPPDSGTDCSYTRGRLKVHLAADTEPTKAGLARVFLTICEINYG